jgi:hypothetical protein
MSEPVEIRADLDREYSDVIDAVAKAKGISRTQMALFILKEWAVQREHESMMVGRLTRGKGVAGESQG